MIEQDSVGFASLAAEKAAWRRHRAELMAESFVSGPGRRPIGYFVNELLCPDAFRFTWFDQVAELLRRGLLDEAEKIAIEAEHPSLGSLQPVEGFESYGTAEGIRRSQIGGFVLQETGREFAFAADWHTHRGRTRLAQKYSRLTQSIRSFVQDANG